MGVLETPALLHWGITGTVCEYAHIMQWNKNSFQSHKSAKIF
jgi:hypothetical protein